MRNTAKITASLITHEAYCKNAIFVINSYSEGSIDIKKSLVSFINSDIAAYYERIIIRDKLMYSLDLFENKEKSQALLPVTDTKPNLFFDFSICS